MSRSVRLDLAFLSLGLLAGCGISVGQPAPADAVELSVYMRDTSRLPHYFLVLGEHQPDPEGPVNQGPATIGCSMVGRDWELIVSQTDTRPDPASDMELRVSGQDFGDADVLSLWISVEPDGTVLTGQGVPQWWGQDIQRCP